MTQLQARQNCSLEALLGCRMHQPCLQANGFEVREAGGGQLALTSVPFSRSTVFGAADVQELLTLLAEHGHMAGLAEAAPLQVQAPNWRNDVIRPSRFVISCLA